MFSRIYRRPRCNDSSVVILTIAAAIDSVRSHFARIAVTLLVGIIGLGSAGAALSDDQGKLPRFASLRANEVNVQTGPGVRYPVDWVMVYRNMPVEIVAEFDTWRKIRDFEGTEGWVHQSMLSSRRSVIVVGGKQPMLRDAIHNAPLMASVEERVVGMLLECKRSWCRVEVAGRRGWLRRDRLWGVYRTETIN